MNYMYLSDFFDKFMNSIPEFNLFDQWNHYLNFSIYLEFFTLQILFYVFNSKLILC